MLPAWVASILEEFNNEARQSVQYMIDNLTKENSAFLEGLPEKIRQNSFTMAHGSPRYPIWEYILNTKMPAITCRPLQRNIAW